MIGQKQRKSQYHPRLFEQFRWLSTWFRVLEWSNKHETNWINREFAKCARIFECCSICQQQTKTSFKYSWFGWQNYVVKGNERPLKVYLYISMRIEKKGKINTRTRKHLPMKQCIFPSGFPIRSSNVDRNVQHKKYRIIKRWWWRSRYKWKRHRLSELLHHWFAWITKTGHFSCSKCCLYFWCQNLRWHSVVSKSLLF